MLTGTLLRVFHVGLTLGSRLGPPVGFSRLKEVRIRLPQAARNATKTMVAGKRWTAQRLVLVLAVWMAVVLPLAAPSTPARAQIRFDIPAESAILIEAETGRVLWEKNSHVQSEPASIAKLMTMLLILEAVDQGIATWDDRVTVSSYAASVGGSTAYLARGESFPLQQIMKAIAIASANDATVAAAEFLAGTEEAFVEAMNKRAAELGMTGTRYVNADGLPPKSGGDETNLTTARDTALLARYIILNYPEVLQWTSTWQEVFREHPRFVLTNTNRLITRYPGADGLKTGYTSAAGYNLAATAQRDGMRLISVVLRTESDQARIEQTERLLDYGFRNFHWVHAAAEGEPVGELRLPGGSPEHVPVRAAAPLNVVVRRGEERNIVRRLVVAEGVRAPVSAGDVVGQLVAYVDDQEVGRVDVVAARDVAKAGALVSLWRGVRDFVVGLMRDDR